jgi:ribokinase
LSVVVLGSINIDLVAEVHSVPSPGQTVSAHGFFTAPGGKGANQAVAAARLGAPTTIIGRVGRDDYGEALVQSLKSSGVDVSGVGVDPEAPTGRAFISLAQEGENSIVTVGGANRTVGDAELEILDSILASATVLLVQLEIPLDVVRVALEKANDAGVIAILDPAPARALDDGVLRKCTWIKPNETEASDLTGSRIQTEADGLRAAKQLRYRGVEHAVVSLGAAGLAYAGPDGDFSMNAPHVEAIDTVAAGDAFNGALAVALLEEKSPREGLEFASAAGALATTRKGAQPSMPGRAELDLFLSRRSSKRA